MRRAVLILLGALIALAAPDAKAQAQGSAAKLPASAKAIHLPLFFEANQGQTDSRVHFMARSSGYTLLLTPTETVLAESKTKIYRASNGLSPFQNPTSGTKDSRGSVIRMQLVGANSEPTMTGVEKLPGKVNYLLGNDPAQWHTEVPLYSQVRTEQVYPGVDLLFHGDQKQLEYDFVVAPGADPSKIAFRIRGAARTEIDAHGDLVLHTADSDFLMHKPVMYQTIASERREIEGRFVRKGKHQVAFQLGAYDHSQSLVIDPAIGFSSFLGGGGEDVSSGFAIDDSTPGSPKLYLSGFTLDSASFSEPKTIIGSGTTMTVPPVIEVGFIAKVDPTASLAASLIYLTFIGGSVANLPTQKGCLSEFIWLALDKSQGAANIEPVLGGQTNCSNFPNATVLNPVTDPSGTSNGLATMAVRLMPSGAAIDKAVTLGGNNNLGGGFIAVGTGGNVILSGDTRATNLPTKNAYVNTFDNGATPQPFDDCFVTILNRADLSISYLTYLNVGTGSTSTSNVGCGAFEDASGNILAGGNTVSPTAFNLGPGGASLANGFQTTFQGTQDTFAMKLNPSLVGVNQLLYATYYGGGGATRAGNGSLDLGNGVVAIVGGTTSCSATLPACANSPDVILANAYQGSNKEAGGSTGETGFLVVLDTTKTGPGSLLCSTYIGGSGGDDIVGAVTYDAGDPTDFRIILGGRTTSASFPLVNSIQPYVGAVVGGMQSPDGFLSVLTVPTPTQTPFNASLVFSTYIGGSNPPAQTPSGPGVPARLLEDDRINAVAVDANHTVYAAGESNAPGGFFANTNPTTTVNGFQAACASCNPPSPGIPEDDVVVFSIATGGNATLQSIAVAPTSASIAVGQMQQFRAVGNFSDGTEKDITGLVTWTTVPAGFATMSAVTPGLATGTAVGSTAVTPTLGAATVLNTGSLTVTAIGPSPLITMSAPGDVVIGTGLTYLIQVTAGSTAATNLTVTDTLPNGLSATSLSSGCTGTTSIICTITSIPAGQTVSLEISVVPTVVGSLSNTATLTGVGSAGPVSTDVISAGVPLVVELDSANAADFVTSSPSSGNCTTAQIICTSYFPSGTVVVLTANGPGFEGWSVNNSSTTCPGTGTCSLTVTSTLQAVVAVYGSVGLIGSALNNGIVGVPYAIDISQSAIGGIPPYTFSISSGNLPTGLALSGSVISGTPATGGACPGAAALPVTCSFTVKVTDSTNISATVGTSITIINLPNVPSQLPLLKGQYAVLFRGVSDADASLRDFVGSLAFDGGTITAGVGTITSGTIDTNGNGSSPAAATISVTGTYKIGSDGRGLIFLNTAAGPFGIFAFSIGDIYQSVAYTAHFIRFDDNAGTGTRGAGLMKRQDPSAFTPISLAGTYIIGVTGQNPGHNRVTEVGVGSVNATGTITSASDDFNDNGTLSTETLVSGTYGTDGANGAISPVGRTQYHLILNNSISGMITANNAVYIVDANTLFSMKIDSGATNTILAGVRERQFAPAGGFNASSLSGPHIVAKEGPFGLFSSSNSAVLIGIDTYTPAAGPNPTTGTNVLTKDVNDDQTVTIQGTENDTYAVAANGRYVITIPGTANQPIGYLSRPDHGYTMDSVADPRFGTIDLQEGGPFQDTSLFTKGFFGDREPASPSGGPVISGVTSVSGNALNVASDASHERGVLDYDQMESLGVFISPAGWVTYTGGAGSITGLVVTPNRLVIADIDPTNHHPNVHDGGSLTMPPGAPLPMSFTVPAFGTVSAGSSAQSAPIAFTNIGDGLLSFTGVTNATDFSIAVAPGTCLTSPALILIQQGTCTAIVTFAPASTTPAGPTGNETVTLHTDAGDITLTASGTVAAGAATHFSVTAPANATAGTAVNFTVTALTAANTTATGYTGTVKFTSSDGNAVLPANSTLTNGTGTFSATLKTAGNQTITATDTVTATITGTSGTITVGTATPVTLRVVMAGTAFGMVTDNLSQISCEQIKAGVSSGTCSTTYPGGTQVTLTASTPGTLGGFSGAPTACTVTGNSCQVTVTTAAGTETVTATFNPGPGIFPLTIAAGTTHTGGGTITSNPAGISCTLAGNTTSGTCMMNFPAGTLVNLTPGAGGGSTFLGWQSVSCLTSSAVNCLVGMTAATNVDVEFTSSGGTVNVTVTGPGNVKDTANAGTINCTNTAGGTQTGTCTAGYGLGTMVTLTEMPTGTATFSAWTGASCPNPNAATCSFIVATATPAYAVTATFAAGSGPTLQSITVTPSPAAVPLTAGGNPATLQFTATGHFSDGSTQNLTNIVNWNVSNQLFAVISNTGLATTQLPGGPVTVTATDGAITGTALLAVGSVVVANPALNEDKQRVDSGSPGLQVILTNTSATQTVHFTANGVSADNPKYTVTSNCSTLNPGATCTVVASFTTSTVCENQNTTITVLDDDPLGPVQFSINGYGADTGLLVSDLTSSNLLVNGSFETPVVPAGGFSNFASGSVAIPGWKVVGAAGGISIVSGAFSQNGVNFPAEDGVQWVDLTGDGTNGVEGLEQTVATTPGTQYTLSFWVGNSYDPGGIFGTTSTVKVLLGGINGTLLGTATNNIPNPGIQTWQQFTMTFTATATTTTIDFINADPSSDNNNGLDNVVLTGGGQSAPGANPSLTPQQLAQSLVGPGIQISNVKYTGAPLAAGTFNSKTNILGFTNGVVLSTGSVRNVVGPNCSTGITGVNNEPGDTDLNNLLGPGGVTNDAAVLEFDFVPTSPTISFQYVFASDEFNEFIGEFNDVFGFFVNGTNIALVPGTNLPVSINNVNSNTNSTFFINNDFQYPTAAPVDTEMDGLTVVLTAQGQVTPNEKNHIKLAIADATDFGVDSNVFIASGSLLSSAVSFQPSSLGFGNQPVGVTSGGQPVTLTNNGATAVSISSIVVAPPFNQTNNCPAQLAPMGQAGSTCIITLTFTPSSATIFTGLLTVTDSSPSAGSQQSIGLSGTGTGTGVATHFSVMAPANATVGTAFNFTVTALTASNTTATGYTGTVKFTSSDGEAALPANSTLTNGTGTFSATLNTVGNQTITATDTVTMSITGTSGAINVTSVATSQLMVQTAGTGTGTVTGNGINCMTGSANGCTVSLAPGTQVTLTAMAAAGSTFTSWSTICESNNNTCMITMPNTATTLTATFTLNAATLKSIAVTPANPTEPTNSSLQFTATGTYSDNSMKDITSQVGWGSSNSNAGTISDSGLATTGSTSGLNTTISATLNEVIGSTTLTVSNSPITIVVTPPVGGTFPPVPPGGKLAVGIVLSTTEGFSGTVTFGCSVTTASGAPAPSINCVPDPSSVNVTPGGPTQVAFVVNTYCTGTAAAATGVPMPGGFGGSSGILLLGLALGGGLLMHRRNPRWALSFAVLALFAVGGVACSSLPKGPNGATPPGNYLLKVTATTNGTTSSTPPIPFTVQ